MLDKAFEFNKSPLKRTLQYATEVLIFFDYSIKIYIIN